MLTLAWLSTDDKSAQKRTLELTEIAAHTPQISTSVQWLSIVFFLHSIFFLLVFWEILRNFERFWEILRNFEKFSLHPAILLFNYNGSHASDFERFWEILRNFEKILARFWEIWEILRNFEKILASFFLVLFSRFDLLPHGIAGICCDNGWSHMQSVSYLLVVLQLLPRLDSWRHCTMKRRHLWQFHCASLIMFAVSLALYCIRTGKLLQIQFYDGWPCLYQPTYVQLHHPSHFDMCPQVEWRIAEYTSCTETLNWTHVSWMWFCNILRFGPMCPKSTIISANNHKLFT